VRCGGRREKNKKEDKTGYHACLLPKGRKEKKMREKAGKERERRTTTNANPNNSAMMCAK
jgi:putative hemolysin